MRKKLFKIKNPDVNWLELSLSSKKEIMISLINHKVWVISNNKIFKFLGILNSDTNFMFDVHVVNKKDDNMAVASFSINDILSINNSTLGAILYLTK